MRRTLLAVLMVGLVSTLSAQRGAPLRVFVSVDMEGISGVVNWEEVDRSGKDYDYFRRLMTKEASAAVEGALAAG
ncbi:MAG: M55 family metallopeptidase, partial [candidate division KSB1 bacterium]|nr:M55 family metallopeptidase [candidate division KSB1 bacterium]